MNHEKELTYILYTKKSKKIIFKQTKQHFQNSFKAPDKCTVHIHSGFNKWDIMLSFVKYIYLNHRYKYNYRYELQLAYTKTLQCS